MSVKQWRKLPWWQQKLYIDGLHDEKVFRYGWESDDEEGENEEEPDLASASDSELRGLGLQVQ